MRTRLALAGLVAGAAAVLGPVAPAAASCIQVEGVDDCLWICPRPVSDHFACTT